MQFMQLGIYNQHKQLGNYAPNFFVVTDMSGPDYLQILTAATSLLHKGSIGQWAYTGCRMVLASDNAMIAFVLGLNVNKMHRYLVTLSK